MGFGSILTQSINVPEVDAMLCATVKAGTDCAFMTKAGCGYNGGSCHQIVDECNGCNRVLDLASGKYCTSYPKPALKWKTGHCNFATHAKLETQSQQQAKVNPLKASKRSGKR
jgi:Family of unknown function (DUF6811)